MNLNMILIVTKKEAEINMLCKGLFPTAPEKLIVHQYSPNLVS